MCYKIIYVYYLKRINQRQRRHGINKLIRRVLCLNVEIKYPRRLEDHFVVSLNAQRDDDDLSLNICRSLNMYIHAHAILHIYVYMYRAWL